MLPSKIFEAAALERPIILGVEGDAAQLVNESGGGRCIEPENELEFLEAVQALKAAPLDAQEMGQRGRSFFAASYDRAALARTYIDILSPMTRLTAEEPSPTSGSARGPNALPEGISNAQS